MRNDVDHEAGWVLYFKSFSTRNEKRQCPYRIERLTKMSASQANALNSSRTSAIIGRDIGFTDQQRASKSQSASLICGGLELLRTSRCPRSIIFSILRVEGLRALLLNIGFPAYICQRDHIRKVYTRNGIETKLTKYTIHANEYTSVWNVRVPVANSSGDLYGHCRGTRRRSGCNICMIEA